ncbi:MAG TPA: DUF6567 family protein [Bacteroidota bacterium]
MNTRSFLFTATLILLALGVTGCSTGGMFTAGNVTDVQLQKNNFKIVARGVSGEAQAGYLFGGTFSMGMATNTFALLRVSGSGMLYKEALENLWKNYEASNGPVEGKKIALVNVRYDADVLNLFVYTQPRITIRADVVEFTE